MGLIYEEPLPILRAEAESRMASGNAALIADALLRASLSQVDPSWIEAASLHALDRPEVEVRWSATLALGHLVRRYGHIDLDSILLKIKLLKQDAALWGRVDDLLSDIQIYLKDADETQLRKLRNARAAHKRGLAEIKRIMSL